MDHAFIVVRCNPPEYLPSPVPNRHRIRESAIKEARRLAALEPGTRFVVFAPVCECVKTDVVQTAIDLDGNPPF